MFGCVICTEMISGAVSTPENKGQSHVKTEDKMINHHVNNKDINDVKDTEKN